jgi:hypothetical protein
MSFVHAAPEFVTVAASDLASIGSTLDAAHAAAVAPTTGVLAAGADEVSAAITTIFAAHAQAYQALSAQAAAFHQQFVQLMNAGAGSYASTEAASVKPLRTLEADISQEEATVSRYFAYTSLQNRLFIEAIEKLAQGDMRVLTDEELAREAQLKLIQNAAINTVQSAVSSSNQLEETIESAIAELAKL